MATVYFSPFSEQAIDSLIEEGQVFHCAGGLMVEHPLVKPFVLRIEGSEETIRGLPVALTNALLSEMEDS